jgi:3-oxoacyl-[acyl-carrier protein] reductase
VSKRFKGKSVLVTGSAGGLGRGFALGFAREGATKLILVDVNPEGLRETAELLQKYDVETTLHHTDLSVEAEIHTLAEAVLAANDTLDVLVNNAGLAYGEISRGFDDLTQAKWLFFFSVNTIAPLLLATALRPALVAAKGSIINITSMASYVPGTAYGITKQALNAVSFGMTSSFGKDGVRVNQIAPGIMATENSLKGVDEDNYLRIQSMQALKGRGETDDIVNGALFLASDDARFISGETLHIDAGHPFRGWRD